jgi:pimeloyl-ACP methyl ester carboxylesterase
MLGHFLHKPLNSLKRFLWGSIFFGLIPLSTQAITIPPVDFVYKLISGDCAPAPQLPATTAGATCNCSLAKPASAIQSLESDFGEVSEDAFLGALANERSQALSCAESQLVDLLKKPADQEKFANEVTTKLLDLLREKKKLSELQTQLGQESLHKSAKEQTAPGTPAFEYKKSKARAEAILASIPFAQSTSMQRLINYVISQDDFILGGKLVRGVDTYIKKMIKEALPRVKKDISKAMVDLREGVRTNGKSLDRLTKESLAQDADLIESYRQKNKQLERTLKPIACRIDVKYGQGAKNRQNALMAVSIVSMGIGAMPSLAAKGAAIAARFTGPLARGVVITGAAARSVISLRAAGILKATSAVVDSMIMIRQSVRACGTASIGGKTAGATCDKSVLTSLNKDNCHLTVALNLIGALGIVSTAKEGFSLMTTKSSLVEEGKAATTVSIGSKLGAESKQEVSYVGKRVASWDEFAAKYKVPGLRDMTVPVKMEDGVILNVEVKLKRGKPGKGTILFTPGLDDRAENWNGAMHFLSQKPMNPKAPDLSDYTMISVSLRGQGKTAEAELLARGQMPREIKMKDQVRIWEGVVGEMEKQGVPMNEIHLVGHSYGGQASLEVAATSRIGTQGAKSKIVSVDLLASYVDHFPNYAPGAAFDPMLAMSNYMEIMNPVGYDLMNRNVLLPMAMQSGKKMGALSHSSDWSDPRRVDGIAAMTADVIKTNTFGRVQEATELHPDLVINVSAGGQDHLVPLAAHQALFDRIPKANRGSGLHIDPAQGHRMTEEDPHGVADWIADVIKQAEQRGSHQAH